VWGSKVAWLHIRVHRHIDFGEDQWLLSTVPRLFDRSMLESKDLEAAKKEAIDKIRQDLSTVFRLLGGS
jgi:hypothetical protein